MKWCNFLILLSYIYVFYFPKKRFIPSHNASKRLKINGFECEYLGLSSLHTLHLMGCGRGCQAWMVWRLWKSKCSHLKCLEISHKMALCERVNSFSRKKITYIEKGCEGLVRLFSRSFFARISSGEVYNQSLPVGVTSPGLVFTTRGLGKNSPGLVKSNPGLVDATRRLVGGSFWWYGLCCFVSQLSGPGSEGLAIVS